MNHEEQEPRLDTVIIFTEHMQLLADFYQEALQLPPFEEAPGHMGRQLGPTYFGFDQVNEVDRQARAAVSLWFAVDDIDATFERLVTLGAQVRYRPTRKSWGAILASVYDPDGNVLGLSQRRPEQYDTDE
jgi:predicted enzyme related to lactoylglutathione lyase